MATGLLIFAVFLVAAALMFFRKLPALLALPLMAVAIVCVEIAQGRLSEADLWSAVVADGAVRLADPIVISLFGGMLSLLMQKAGVAESLVRRGAELAGDNPWAVSLIMLVIITILFTTIGGLGAVIMVGTMVLPILLSIGVRDYIAAGVMVTGISLGGLLNAGNWTVYRTVLSLESDTVSSFALVLFGVSCLVAVVFLTVELLRTGVFRLRRRSAAGAAKWILALAVLAGVWRAGAGLVGSLEAANAVRLVLSAGGVLLLAGIVIDRVRAFRAGSSGAVRWYAYLIPLVPLVLILLYGLPFLPAFMLGLGYGILATFRRGMVNLTSRAIIEGSASVIPAVVLMIGIGMLLSAILGPTPTGAGSYWYAGPEVRVWPVLADMKPLLETIVPDSFLSYVVIFALLGPFALYRGPLNVWGLGYGVGGILLATGIPAGAVMGILMSLGMIQGVSDPTNTANVWIANEVRLDVNSIMWRTLPYAWLMATLGLVAAGMRYML